MPSWPVTKCLAGFRRDVYGAAGQMTELSRNSADESELQQVTLNGSTPGELQQGPEKDYGAVPDLRLLLAASLNGPICRRCLHCRTQPAECLISEISKAPAHAEMRSGAVQGTAHPGGSVGLPGMADGCSSENVLCRRLTPQKLSPSSPGVSRAIPPRFFHLAQVLILAAARILLQSPVMVQLIRNRFPCKCLRRLQERCRL